MCDTVMKGSRQLSSDLVEEILCRVPVTSATHIRWTCKLWNRLFNEKRFTIKHSFKAPKQFMSLMLTKNYRVCPMSLNFRGNHPSIELKAELNLMDPLSWRQFDIAQVFHCDGLLLCTSDDDRMVIWNPLTGQTRWIDAVERAKKGRRFSLGYSHSQEKRSWSKRYKVLSIPLDVSASLVTEVYDLDSDSWRILDSQNWANVCSDHMVSFKGNTYWFVTDKGKLHLGLSLLRFDFSTEKFERVPFPYQYLFPFRVASFSVVREEKLALVLQQEIGSKAEVWLTDMIGETVSWSKVLAVDLSPELQVSFDATFLFDEEKKLLICCERWLHETDETCAKGMVYVVGEDNNVTQKKFGHDLIDGPGPAILTFFPNFGSNRELDLTLSLTSLCSLLIGLLIVFWCVSQFVLVMFFDHQSSCLVQQK